MLHTKFIGNYSLSAVTDDMIDTLRSTHNVGEVREHDAWLVIYRACLDADNAWRKTYGAGLARASERRRKAERKAYAHKAAMDALCDEARRAMR